MIPITSNRITIKCNVMFTHVQTVIISTNNFNHKTIAGHGKPVTNRMPRTAGHGKPATNRMPRTAGHGTRATYGRPRKAGHVLQDNM